MERLKELLDTYYEKLDWQGGNSDGMAGELRHMRACWNKMREDGVIPAGLDTDDIRNAVIRAEGLGGTVREWLDGSALEAASRLIKEPGI